MKLSYKPKLFTCICCGAEKPESEYYRQSYTGIRENQCKVCVNVKKSVNRHKAKHGKFISKEKHRNMIDTIDYTLRDWKDVMLHFGGECAFCGKTEGRSKKDKHDRDHVIAISKGGKTVRENIICACSKCNRGRGNRDWDSWFRRQDTWTQEREDRIKAWVEQGGGLR